MILLFQLVLSLVKLSLEPGSLNDLGLVPARSKLGHYVGVEQAMNRRGKQGILEGEETGRRGGN